MAYVTQRSNGTWELREATTTPGGPRSRTLASFRGLTPEVIAHARSRARGPLSEGEIRRATHKAGAPVAPAPADRAAAELVRELAAGREPRPALRRLLAAVLDGPAGEESANAAAATQWIAATPADRGAALRDLLLLADRLPEPRAIRRTRFPRIASGLA